MGLNLEIEYFIKTIEGWESNYEVINILPEVQCISDEVIFLCKKKPVIQ